ncbi:hypothetical protein AGLY_009331 [Aphis glycines]|uniref:Uncharacterized protein n=1 Tax=Aphis glycines TaxID=307491 RepID=A0A6G0TIP0_APHGL|nr:hypothetical protein AGLY_009331 [Aphis glycines]
MSYEVECFWKKLNHPIIKVEFGPALIFFKKISLFLFMHVHVPIILCDINSERSDKCIMSCSYYSLKKSEIFKFLRKNMSKSRTFTTICLSCLTLYHPSRHRNRLKYLDFNLIMYFTNYANTIFSNASQNIIVICCSMPKRVDCSSIADYSLQKVSPKKCLPKYGNWALLQVIASEVDKKVFDERIFRNMKLNINVAIYNKLPINERLLWRLSLAADAMRTFAEG